MSLVFQWGGGGRSKRGEKYMVEKSKFEKPYSTRVYLEYPVENTRPFRRSNFLIIKEKNIIWKIHLRELSFYGSN